MAKINTHVWPDLYVYPSVAIPENVVVREFHIYLFAFQTSIPRCSQFEEEEEEKQLGSYICM